MRLPGYAALTALINTFTFALIGCAHMEAPPGGPADTKRPYVSAVSPAPESTHVSRDLHVQIAFSEWVNPEAQRGKVYLNPPVPKKLKTELDGNILTVTSAARLDTGTTYTLGMLGSIKDLNGLMLEGPFELVFSTGAKLDSGRVSGRVLPFQAKATAGSYAALYPRGAELRARFQHLTNKTRSGSGDSVVTPEPQPNPLKEKPAYLAPADSLGRFTFKSIRPGRYGMLGFQDINGNLNPEVGVEALAIGPTVEVAAVEEVKTLTLFAYDTLPLKLVSAKWVGERIRGKLSEGSIRLKFNRSPHPLQALLPESYRVSRSVHKSAGKQAPAGTPDAEAGKPMRVLDVCVHPVTGEIELHTEPLALNDTFLVACNALKDPYGNAMDTSRSRIELIPTGEADTSKAEMTFFGPRKINGEQEKIGPEKLIPSRGLAAYYPRLLDDSTFKDLQTRLVIKADTVNIPFKVLRANHHEFALQFPGLSLKGQRLQIGFKPVPEKPAPGKAAPATGPVPAPTPGTGTDSAGRARAPASKDSLKASPPAPPAPVTVATFSLADAAKMGSLKFKQTASAYGSRLVLRSLSSPAEFGRQTPPMEEFTVDSLPEGWYAADYFRDANGDGIWNPGSLSPWNVQEPYVQWSDSLEVKAAGAPPASGSVAPPATQPKSPPVTPPKNGGDRRMAWPPSW